MFEYPENPGVFDFDELADQLLEQGAEVSPARVHGCLSGLLAAGDLDTGERALDALAQGLELVAQGQLAETIMHLYAATASSLADEACIFYPLLPDDEQPIEARTQALADWSGGFITGVALAAAAPGADVRPWSSEGREILEDIAAMSQAVVDPEDYVEEPEDNYTELVEYLRIAVLNLYLERRPDEPVEHGITRH
tara:strand:- start:8585 stop:9172 length:588 start_codon:yes stop_codon:yes gene_type:complete